MVVSESLATLTAQMEAAGIRRLLVLSGDETWSSQQAQQLANTLPGDWLWVGSAPEMALNGAPGAINTLLGREYLHAVFDARSGFDAAAFAALAGTLKAGSWLVLLTPPWQAWPTRVDNDACRWSDSREPIPTPHFIHHLQHLFTQDPDVICWRQEQPLQAVPSAPRPRWRPAHGEPQREQALLLDELLTTPDGVTVITAARGRGKSALAGMFIRALPGRALVTAPARASADVIAAHAGDKFQFMAPDALLAALDEGTLAPCDWLIIDEAAALPGPVLQKLVRAFPAALLTSTVQGYEGTGRGFLLKFCAGIDGLRYRTLSTPVRWAQDDPLERLVSQALLFDDDDFAHAPAGEVHFYPVNQRDLQTMPDRAAALYRLLAGAHYRTSPLDLRRMMDAPNQSFIAAEAGGETVGALWLVAEGGLEAALSQAVWAGYRRPRGNLVAQSLAAHGGDPLAATLRGLRISRVAVHPGRQREGIGRQLIEQAPDGCDYLSVSFGYTPALWRFWQRCGFTLVRFGSHREASSGCYNAMALLPLSTAGSRLVRDEHQRLVRDAAMLQRWVDETLPLTPAPQATLNEDDWLALAGFAFAHRPLETSLGPLYRLLEASPQALQALRGRLELQTPVDALCRQLGLSGRKALLAALRQETALALEALDAQRAAALNAQLMQWQFFH
ncbi:tRNA(Met) cytidine acetyltransferase [Cronobacter turicensis]|nr:tRNA(Met) cytidine acetyltransferase [Cronobacter turicensis]ELY3627435.1 tRNA(Met) cytidine acetyltransferase [Cronobacter turicensis]